MAIRYIDMKLCAGCGMCENYCPVDVIRFDQKSKLPVIRYPEDCMLCCLCEVKCPVHAITVTPEKKQDCLLAWS